MQNSEDAKILLLLFLVKSLTFMLPWAGKLEVALHINHAGVARLLVPWAEKCPKNPGRQQISSKNFGGQN